MGAYLAFIFDMLVCFGVPLAVAVWCLVRRRHMLLPFFAGVAAFVLSQLVLRTPLLRLLSGKLWFATFKLSQPALYYILLGLSAGVFEELARWGAMLLMLRFAAPLRQPQLVREQPGFARGCWDTALVFGVGHGGVEAVWIGAMALEKFIDMWGIMPSLPPLGVALTGIERVFAMVLHVGLSVMVMRTVQNRRPAWLLLAILVHGAVDAAVGLLPLWFGAGILAIEGLLAITAAGLIVFVLLAKPPRFLAATTAVPQGGGDRKENDHEETL